MDKRKIIFVGGVHAVGKGTICKKIAQKYNFEHLSASQVLRWEEISNAENKVVKDIEMTQDRLLTNLNKIIQPDKKYLLDGHFTLLDTNGVPKKIDKTTFIGIQPKSIILITCDPQVILERLIKRDNTKYKLETIEEMQAMEIEHATYISKMLCVPLFMISNEDISLIEHLETL